MQTLGKQEQAKADVAPVLMEVAVWCGGQAFWNYYTNECTIANYGKFYEKKKGSLKAHDKEPDLDCAFRESFLET